MDINQYQKDRNAELSAFKKEYTDMKVQYTNLLTQAVYERDPSAQASLVKQVLEINSTLAAHVREFLSESTGKFDPKTIADLTDDIIRYQKEYTEIKNASDKTKTLQNILNKETVKLEATRSEFNIFLGLLLGGILIVLILIFTTYSKPTPVPDLQLPNTSMFDSGSGSGWLS
jgi:hypothetical protein